MTPFRMSRFVTGMALGGMLQVSLPRQPKLQVSLPRQPTHGLPSHSTGARQTCVFVKAADVAAAAVRKKREAPNAGSEKQRKVRKSMGGFSTIMDFKAEYPWVTVARQKQHPSLPFPVLGLNLLRALAPRLLLVDRLIPRLNESSIYFYIYEILAAIAALDLGTALVCPVDYSGVMAAEEEEDDSDAHNLRSTDNEQPVFDSSRAPNWSPAKLRSLIEHNLEGQRQGPVEFIIVRDNPRDGTSMSASSSDGGSSVSGGSTIEGESSGSSSSNTMPAYLHNHKMQVVIEVKHRVNFRKDRHQLLAQLDAAVEWNSQYCQEHALGGLEAWGVLTDLQAWHFFKTTSGSTAAATNNAAVSRDPYTVLEYPPLQLTVDTQVEMEAAELQPGPHFMQVLATMAHAIFPDQGSFLQDETKLEKAMQMADEELGTAAAEWIRLGQAQAVQAKTIAELEQKLKARDEAHNEQVKQLEEQLKKFQQQQQH